MMPLPLLGGMTAAIVAGFSAFVASRGAWILAGLGVGFTAMKGMQVLAGFIIADMQLIVSTIGGLGGGGGAGGFGHLGVVMLQLAAYSGLFDALNIVIGGFMASYGLIATRVVLRRIAG